MVKRTVVNKVNEYPWVEWPGGRLLLAALNPMEGITQCEQFTPLVIGNLSKDDVLCLQLFEEAKDVDGVVERGDYNDVLALIDDVGPRVGGILIGQELGVELSFRYKFEHWMKPDPHIAADNMNMCADFIRRVGDLLRPRGATPFFAPMDWEILQDAYKANGIMRNALASVGATAFVACAYTLVPGCYVKPDPLMKKEHMQIQRKWSKRHDDYPVLKAYLRSGNFWAGLGGIDGIRGGNIEKLSEYGFKGFATKLPTQEIQDALVAERGVDWWM